MRAAEPGGKLARRANAPRQAESRAGVTSSMKPTMPGVVNSSRSVAA